MDERAGLDEIDRLSSELGIHAVSFHTEYQGVTIDNPWMMRYISRMGELGMVPLIHASDVVLHEALWRLGKVARAFPDLTIVAIEPFFTHEGALECAFLADVVPNVVFETASAFDTDMMLDLMVSVGADRFVYGSQHYSEIRAEGALARSHVRRATTILGDIVGTPRLTDADKALILGANARKILGTSVSSSPDQPPR
jgi:predicted TIM-barrel fold metal-dependent hydrolase